MKKRNRGFTLVELVVVLVVLAIIAAIATPFFINYWRRAEFQKNESNAQTVYLAAEEVLTYYRNSGQWEEFKQEIIREGNQNPENSRIYAVKLDAGSWETAGDCALLKLLDESFYDKSFFAGSVAVEIDVESGEAYSAFYGTKCKGLTYAEADKDGYLTMQDRAYDSRSDRLLGYYSTEDTVNMVSLKPKKLRITTINLLNSEQLSLNWSSNAGDSRDVSYKIAFYRKSDDTKLFSMTMSPYDMDRQGWAGASTSTAAFASFELFKSDGSSAGQWAFPVYYSNGRYSLVLDAMMSAEVQAMLQTSSSTGTSDDRERLYSTNIQRLQSVSDILADPVDIYATVQAVSYAGSETGLTISQEYRSSEEVSSNTANSMYGDDSTDTKLKIAAFRHLSNIRYFEKTDTPVTFEITGKNMNWCSVGTGLFAATETGTGATAQEKLYWVENTETTAVDFPAIAEFASAWTLDGNNRTITNLRLGETSIIDDAMQVKSGSDEIRYLGLFSEVEGTIKSLTLQDASLELGMDTASSHTFHSLLGVGILAGRCSGTLTDINVTLSAKQQAELNGNSSLATVRVSLKEGGAANSGAKTAAVGGIVGVGAGEDASGSLTRLKALSWSGLSMNGRVTAILPEVDWTSDGYKQLSYGIGGIAGYAYTTSAIATSGTTSRLQNCENHAQVSGNSFTGGIVGRLDSNLSANTLKNQSLEAFANIQECTNDGLILCTADTGHYFGGIIGYAFDTVVQSSSSASGRASGFSYDKSRKELLKGYYVGGIVGYGAATVVSDCSTEKNGYILGADYVGGIAGGMDGGLKESIQAQGISVTTNASYVIGNNYVGGIVGENIQNTILKNCVNNGVVAGYGCYVGGIAGYNGKDTEIYDCASYLSDYDNSIFQMIVTTWEATGDCVGGIAGYNDGKITFTADSKSITVKSVASIVVGEDYVGGIVGFNDENASLDVAYTLIGGRIYAYGNCAGGAFGLNASTSVLEKTLSIKPQSVQGKYYVGGCIGANVVNLTKDTTMGGFRADNILGSIQGEAFCGGIIGYQRTYTAAQVSESDTAYKRFAALLPGLDGNNIPENVAASANLYKLVITTTGNTDSSLTVDTNNIPIAAHLYAGGIVGYCEKNSKLLIKNCKNAGNLSFAEGSSTGASLKKFIESKQVNKTVTVDESIRLHFVGGITGVNLSGEVIDHCSNTGSLSGFTGIGGIVSLNDGEVLNCSLEENFGNSTLDYIGGITGVNLNLVQNCTTAAGKTISGRSNTGGIAGWNITGGLLKNNISYASITASGSYVGGVCGRNGGSIVMGQDEGTQARTIDGRSGVGIGGIAGLNETTGTIKLTDSTGSTKELTAVSSAVTVWGQEKVGGIVGINEGTLGESSNTTGVYLVCQAKLVRASLGTVGGIAGTTSGNIYYAKNRSESVSADAGLAGGIVAENGAGKLIAYCENHGSVTSSNGYAGGIAAKNLGTINKCEVSGAADSVITIGSRGVTEIGAVCAVNEGTIQDSAPTGYVTLSGQASVFGGVAGTNDGTITSGTDTNFALTYMPAVNSSAKQLTVGGAAGRNYGAIRKLSASLSFSDFSSYQYLGGITGQNGTADTDAIVESCDFSGTIKESSGAAGNCYGGIAGINYTSLKNCEVKQITLSVKGVYTATSTATAAQKEQLASHAGGIAGKNETTGTIEGCLLDDNKDSSLTAQYGMLGGVTGFNKGSITLSGSNLTKTIMTDLTTDGKEISAEALASKAAAAGLKKDTAYVNWNNNGIESETYNGTNTKVTAGRMQMKMTSNGNIGGITAYNGQSGAISQCVSGNWFLLNKSEAIGVGTGGIIGMNESDRDLSFLINGAFVGRQLATGATNRFAGGIIGNQNNSTGNEWTISKCINYGTIYCFNTHYSGGILGQWTGSGGTLEGCLNYGNLQTTYQAGWIGASGGIVAQLYHAYSNHSYNIISCGNYGSIYTRDGRYANETGANDSAGILGNVTTYKVSNASNGQTFSIQILDCFNAPGVEIYSASMASGILGFLSCDDASASNIVNSTSNVSIRIERCRNFADKLKGKTFGSGIFGDRYGNTGWSNTVVKDCYTLRASDYSKKDCMVLSADSGSTGTYGNMPEKSNNFYLNGTNGTDSFSGFQTGISFTERSYTGSGIIYPNDYRWQRGNGLNGRYAWSSYLMYDATAQMCFVGILNQNAVGGQYHMIDDETGYILDQNGDVHGRVLFYTNSQKYTNMSDISTNPTNIVFLNSRTQWAFQEGVETVDGAKKLKKVKAVATSLANGKLKVTITPDETKVMFGTKVSETVTCDPFAYLVRITDENGHTYDYTLYTENGSIDLPEGLSGALKVSVQAVSMYEDVEPSDFVEADGGSYTKILPAPDVRVDLVADTGNWYYYHAYRFSLNNLADYTATEENGDDFYPNWQVVVRIPGVGDVTLNSQTQTATLRCNSAAGAYQMIAVASSSDTSQTNIQASKEVSTAIYLPTGYRAPAALDGSSNVLKVSSALEGTTLDTLSLTVNLAAANISMDTPPVYRVELLGDWTAEDGTEYKDTVLAWTDMLTVSKGTASATLTDFPDYLATASNFRIRIWYAATGLGPVYTYYPLTQEDTAGGLVKVLTDVAEDGTAQWSYLHSTVLENTYGYFNNYQKTLTDLFTLLPAPVLANPGTTLIPTVDSTGTLNYTFTWDESLAATETTNYEVALTGIDETGKEVVISLGDAYKQGERKLVVDGSSWTYRQVKLTVTRIGDASKKQIGLSASAVYTVKPRLSQPGQPGVANTDVNELNYSLSWTPIAEDNGTDCAGYQAYIYEAQKGIATAVKLGARVEISEKNTTTNTYTETVNLEDYAGKRVVIYLVAEAPENGIYLNSAAGVTYELQIPERLTEPKVEWKFAWSYDKNSAVDAEAFLNGSDGKLRVTLTAQDDASIPPGGSGYLMKAYVYDTQEAAEAATEANPGSFTAYYPPGTIPTQDVTSLQPVQMTMQSSKVYYHDLTGLSIQNAGKYVVFYGRISSGSGSVSSKWVKSGVSRLPYVKLATPTVASSDVQSTRQVLVSDKPNTAGTLETWKLVNTMLSWESVESADAYTVSLGGALIDNGIRTELTGTLEIIERTTDGVTTPEIIYRDAAGTEKTVSLTQSGNTWEGTVSEYGITISGSYKKQLADVYYENLVLATEIIVTKKEDGSFSYQLILPDITSASVKGTVTSGDADETETVITNESFQITSSVSVKADVQDTDSSYVASEEREITWSN